LRKRFRREVSEGRQGKNYGITKFSKLTEWERRFRTEEGRGMRRGRLGIFDRRDRKGDEGEQF
jgi:hypothetical protein